MKLNCVNWKVGGLKVVSEPVGLKLLPFLEVSTKKVYPITKEVVHKVRLAAVGD